MSLWGSLSNLPTASLEIIWSIVKSDSKPRGITKRALQLMPVDSLLDHDRSSHYDSSLSICPFVFFSFHRRFLWLKEQSLEDISDPQLLDKEQKSDCLQEYLLSVYHHFLLIQFCQEHRQKSVIKLYSYDCLGCQNKVNISFINHPSLWTNIHGSFGSSLWSWVPHKEMSFILN